MTHDPVHGLSISELVGPVAGILSGGLGVEIVRRLVKPRRLIRAEVAKAEADALAAQAEAAQRIAQSFESLVKQLSEQNAGLRDEVAVLKEELEAMRAAAEKADATCTRRIRALKTHVQKLSDALIAKGVEVEPVPDLERA